MSVARRFSYLLILVLAVLAAPSLLPAAITLSSATSPTAATVGNTVNVTGNGFPSGTIPGTSVSVTITCPPGNGGAVTVPSTSVTNILTQKTIYFTIPAALTANQPITCQVTVAGSTPSAYSSSPSSATLTINPPPSISSVSPGAGTQGTAVTNVAITGNFTHFKNIQPAQPTVTVGGSGVTVSNVNATDNTHLTATFTIDAAAAPGIRTVTVKNGSETSSIANGFLVSVNPAVSVAISPQSGVQGTTFDVHITGTNTTFTQGTSIVSLGDGITINHLTVVDTTHATANISIDPIAFTGGRTFTITTGGEYGTLPNGFAITASAAALTSILPTGGAQGSNATITFTGNGTHWVPAGSTVSFGGGIVVGTVTVLNNQSLTANISVPATTAPGSYSATVTTNGEVVTLPNAFAVAAATPHLTGVTPTSGAQGQTLDVAITGQFTTFTALPAPTFNFGPNIAVNTVAVTDDTHVKANITIANTAFAGGRTASLTSNGTIFNFSFTVNSSAAAITAINPTSGYQGASVAIQVTGVNTHWVDGLTSASLDPIWITINRVKVTSSTTAEVDISIAGNAPIGARTVTLSTGGEIVTFNSFTVLQYTPTMSVNPGSGMIGTTVPVVFNGSFTHWVDQVTVANIDGQGVSITGFKVDSPWTAHASLVIDPTAPNNGCAPGNRTVTLTTVQGTLDEIVTAPFCVTSTPAYLTSITPNHSPAGVNGLLIDIYGANTHFDNTTTVGFGPNITVVGNPNIISATHLQVTINIGANPPTALGWRQAFVNSACASCVPANPEQLTIGFNIDYPATSSLVSISPSTGAQGQALTGVIITGKLSNWNATTEAILGLGVTVSNLQVVNSTTATADVTISPTTPVGGRTVSMITNSGAEVESGLNFSVTPSIASVVAVGIASDCSPLATNCPAPVNTIATINQGDTKSFQVVGTATHFLQGETTLDFGPGISITQVQVVDATHLYGQITVSFSAATGYRSFRAITDGEIAPSFTNAVNVLPVTGTINITPTTAPQGTTLDITVNGVGATHFSQGNTTATFGNNSGIIGKFGGTSNLSGADVTVVSSSVAILHVIVQGTAFCCTAAGDRDLTVTTTGVPNPPTNVEQITLPLAFFITQGAAIITNVTPNQDYQGHSVQINVTGQNTNFANGVTTAYLTTGGCNPASPAGAVVTNVTVTDLTHASLAVAIDVAASTGVRGLCMFTQGESVGYLNAFNVLPGIPTLNQVGPVSGLQGQTLTGVTLTGNFTHWTAAGNTPTTVTFGQGITVSNLVVVDATHATATLTIDPLAQLGGRTVTVTTGNEVVSGNLFAVNAGPAILSTISPSHGNQGQQHILMQINGNFTHWSQGLTQFSIGGAGADITINGFAVQSQISAVADISISPTASLGTRTVTMSTAGEVVSLNQAFLVTGGIPSIISISPSSYKQCDTNDNVQIAGVFTKWLSGGSPTTVFMGPNITVNSVTVNSDTALTAIISVPCGAPLGLQPVTVQGPVSISGAPPSVVGLAGQVQILTNAPPTPYISYETPSVALTGQTLTVYLSGQYTHWLPASDPNATQVTFGAGITVNNFQVTSQTSAAVNITIQPTAATGSRTVILTTGGTEVETTSFYVTVGTPAISLVDGPNGSTGIQGQTLTVNLVGAYTTWDASMSESNFNFGQGITVVSGSFQIFGPTAVRMQITIDITANLGGRTVIATHSVPGGTETAYGSFSVSPSSATINTVTPNTAMQGTQGFVTHVVGFDTHWNNSTQFTFGGSDVGVTQVTVNDATHADVTLNLAPLANPGLRNVVAQTGGEIATLVNGFVVTPGTPILTSCVSCSSSAVIQQNTFHISILGQFTSFDATTTVDLGNGLIINPGTGLNDNTKGIDITGSQSIDVTGHVDPLAYTGCRNVTVTTGGTQVLRLYSAVCVGQGPAVISLLNPNTGFQGTTFDVNITGTNTNFCCVNPPSSTVANFGQGISINTLTINSATSAKANITIAANALSQQNSVTLTTQGEIATIPLAFTIQNNTPVVSFVSPNSGAQGAAAFDVTVQGTFTHWVLGQTSADFGSGITANVTAIPDSTHATVHVTISPIASTGNHAVRMITNIGGGNQEIAVYTINNSPGYFMVSAGPAAITAVNPVTPASVHQNDSGDIVQIVGSATHFTQATPAVNFPCIGQPAAIQVVDDTHINATINVGTFAQTGACNVTVTTGGEVASGTGLLNILPGLPVITNASANQAHQGDTVSINVTGLYTHFLSGFTCAFCGNSNVTVNTHTANSDTSLTLNITINAAAPTGPTDVTVQDPTDGLLADHNAFTILAGVPTLQSISIANGPQGLTQNEHLVGLFTHWSASSVVSVSGTGVTVGNPPTSPDATDISVNFQVALGAPAGPRTVTVTTGTEVVSLPNAFTVQPGSPNVSGLTPNIGAPNSTVDVQLTGVFTNWSNGSTTANFGPGIGVNGGALGATNVIAVSDSTHAVAHLTIDSSAALGPRNVVINTPAPPAPAAEMITVINGFTVQSAPGPLTVSTITPSMGLSGTTSASNVPINTNIVVTFNEPIDPASVAAANAFITDSTTQGCWAQSGLPATVTTDVSGRFITITPTSLLGVGRTFYLQLNSYSVPGGTAVIKDASDTQSLGHYCQSFSTGFSQDPVGPTFLTGSIPNSATGVPINVHPTVGFDKPVSPATISGLTFTQGGNPVAGTWSYSSDYTQYAFVPSSNLTAGTTYLLTYTNSLTDTTGHPLTNPGTLTFTTGTATDTSGPSVTLITPIYNSTVGTGPTFRIVASEPMNPLTFNDVYVWNNVNGGTDPGSSLFTGTLSWSADYKTFTYTLAQPLPASTQFYWHMCSGRDWAGNGSICFNQYFYTGTGPDSTPPSVVSVSPPDTTTSVAVNAPVWVHFSEAIDPTIVPANAISVTPGPVAGTIAFNGTDYSTLILTPSANLAASTTYHVAVSGVVDTSGNPLTPFGGSSFTTSSSATSDTTHGTVTVTPTGSNVPVNTNVVFQLSKPVNPASVNSLSMRVYDSTIGHDIPGTIAVSSDLKTLTFTPSTSCSSSAHCLPANHQICTWNGNPGYLYDIDGLNFNFTSNCFNTTNTVDTTLPAVISVTPPDTSTGIGPTNPVVLTFNKPLNPGTIQNNVAMYVGSSLYTSSYNLSADATTISFNTGNLPYGTTFTVVAGVNVTDLQGNHPAAESRTSFTTAAQPVNTRPSVNAVRPASGATNVPANSSITFFTSAPMNPSTVTATSVHVSQNGALLNGSISFSADNEAITFVPAVQFSPGALIQVWFTSAAQDSAGNPLYDYYQSFTVGPAACTMPTVTGYSAGRYNSGLTPNYVSNSVIEVQFCEPINPATVTSASFNVRANSSTPGSGNPVSGTISFANNNSLIRFTPIADYNLGNYIAVQLTSAIQDMSTNSFAGDGFWIYIQSTAAHDGAAPFVTGMAPTNGSTGIGSNALVSVTFNEDVDPMTLIPANVTLTGPGGNIPLSISYNSNNYTMTITPQAPLPAGVITLQLTGVADYAGNVLNPTPFSSSFTVMNGADYSGPSVVLTSWIEGVSNLPLNSSFSITFNKPIDLRSANYGNNGSIRLWDCSINCGTAIPATISWSGGNTVLLITPTGLLNVGHNYRIYVSGLSDLNGNGSGTLVNSNVYTAFTAPAGGPQVISFVTPNGFSNVPENFKPQIQFDRPIQSTALSGITMVKMPGSVPVAFTAQLSAGGTILTLVPNSILLPAVQYQVTVAGVQDAAGDTMAGSVTHAFTTGHAIDLVAPQVVSVTPLTNATVGTNPLLKIVFSEPINPISATNFAIYDYGTGRYVNQVSLTWSADLKSVVFNYPGPLDPNDHFYFYLNSFADLAGNTSNSNTQQFFTSSAVDNTPLTVTSVNPPNGTTGVPVNPAIAIRLSKPAAPTSVNNLSVMVSGVPGTTVSLSSDGMTLAVTLPANLSPNIAYTINAGGFTDGSGNAVTPFSSTFTTSASGLSDTSHGGVSLTVPAPGSTGVALNQVITVTFSKPFDPVTLVQDSLIVCYNNNCNNRIAGTVAIVDANHLSFTPAGNMPPSTVLGVFVYPFTQYMRDLAGNPFDNPYLYNATFTTAAVTDNTPPTVIGQSPASGATGVGPYATVSLTFNKSLNQSTVTGSNFALYNGSSNIGANVSISSDRRTVFLSTTLPWSSTITVSANTNVQDYSGNNMASPYSATFTTEQQPLSFNPSVIQVRPGSGAPLNSAITMYTNSPINLSTAQNGVKVAQNGVLISGTVTLTADQHGIIWTPAAPYQPGAFLEVWATNSITDLNNNTLNSYYFTFTTAAATCTTPTITSYPIGRYNSSTAMNYITNPVIDVQFCGPLNPATVNNSSVFLCPNTSGSGCSPASRVNGTITLLDNNTIVRFKPAVDLNTSNYVNIQYANTIQDMSGNSFAGDNFWIYIQNTAVHDNTPVAVSSVTPINGATGIGDNAPIRIAFNKTIDTVTANPASVTINGGAIPYTYTFNSNANVMSITPLSPLPDSSTINVDVSTGVTDLTGASITDYPFSFQTTAGADFTGPTMIQRSIDDNERTNVPVNTTFTMVFDKPLDPSTVVGNPTGGNTSGFFYYDSSCPSSQCYPPSTVNLSPDLKTVTIIPSSNLTPSVGTMYYYWRGANDLNGNGMTNSSQQYFTTAASTDATPPTVIGSNPMNGFTNAPTNAAIEVMFSKAVRATSLTQFTLNGSPVTAVLNSSVYTDDQVVKLVPSTLLSPNTVYTVVAQGVQDVAGNTLAAPYTFSFTTGPNFNVNGPSFQSATVTTSGGIVPLPQNTNVSNVLKTNPVFTFVWDTPLDLGTFIIPNSAITLTDTSNNVINVPLTYVLSADQKTVQVTVNGTLSGNTNYRIWIRLQGYPYSVSGYYDGTQRQFPFVTQP